MVRNSPPNGRGDPVPIAQYLPVRHGCARLVIGNLELPAETLDNFSSFPQLVPLHHLKQVVLNLLSNACKFTEGGEVTLAAALDRVDGTDWLKITVSDTGIGMTPEQSATLFQAFNQADDSMTRRDGGTGRGRAIHRRHCRTTGVAGR